MNALVVLALIATAHAEIYSLDSGWKFSLEGSAPIAPCPPNAFTKSLDGQQTLGLKEASAITEERCADECCADPSCETYQFCNSSVCGSGPPQQPSCWIGRLTGANRCRLGPFPPGHYS